MQNLFVMIAELSDFYNSERSACIERGRSEESIFQNQGLFGLKDFRDELK